MKVNVVKKVLDAHERIAEENRNLFDHHNIFVMNVMSSPGAGKTSLLEHTIQAMKSRYRIAVIEGDIQDTYDADRIAQLNIPVVQINTGGACHIDGNMICEALPSFDLNTLDVIIVENVGNLVCPAEFKVGENIKVMLLSTPEGADKPAKYPLMFKESAALLINKMDLMPYVNFDLEKARHDALTLNKNLKIFEVSCKTGMGLETWLAWLAQCIDEFKKQKK